ncbi:MAG TPA: AIR synthase-related protein, partial [Verrucomicrobiaceae bacterium]
GALVETTKGMAQAAEIYGTPFVSGKDSFYNYFKTDDGPVSIPCTLLVSGFGIIEEVRHVIGASLRGAGNKLCMLGRTCNGSLGSVQLRCSSAMVDGKLRTIEFSQDLDESKALGDYGRYHQLVKRGFVLSAHDVGEGGLAVALAEMGFTNNAGIKADLQKCPNDIGHDPGGMNFLFVETPARVIFEVAPENAHLAEELGFPVVGETTNDGRLVITDGETRLIDEPLSELKLLWKNGLVPYY